MSGFSRIDIEHYKRFSNSISLDLAPLTILCGVNGSGKSTIMNSLLTLKQCYEDSSVANFMKLNGPLVKNGSYWDTINSRGRGPRLGVAYDLAGDIDCKFSVYGILARLYNTEKMIHIELENTIEHYGTKANNNTLVDQTIKISFGDTVSTIQFKKVTRDGGQLYDILLTNFPHNGKLANVTMQNAQCHFENFVFAGGYSDEHLSVNEAEVFSNLASICRCVISVFKGVKCVRPSIEYLQRRYLVDNLEQGSLPQLLKSYDGKKLCFVDAPIDGKLNFNSYKRIFNNVVDSWLTYLDIGTYWMEQSDNTLRFSINGRDLADVGLGVNQVLSILANSITQPLGGCLLLEQPEMFLHPKFQLNMADFLVCSAMSGRNMIVETHSDHVINRVVRRVMEDQRVAQNVKIYFIENGTIEEINIDPCKGTDTDKEDFFTQFETETMAIVKIGMNNWRSSQGK